MGTNALGLYNVRQLYRLVPPHTALLFVYEFDVTQDIVPVDIVREGSLGYFSALEVTDAVVDGLIPVDRVGLRMISTTCQ
jgi:hypothetical protein